MTLRTAFITLAFLAAGCGDVADVPKPLALAVAPRQAAAVKPVRNPVGVIALSDVNYRSADNPQGWAYPIAHAPTVSEGIVEFIRGGAKLAKREYAPCNTIIVWDGFAGQADSHPTSYQHDQADLPPGVTPQTILDSVAAAKAEGIALGVIIRPSEIVQGRYHPKQIYTDPLASLQHHTGYDRSLGLTGTTYVDSNLVPGYYAAWEVLPPALIKKVTSLYPGTLFLMEHWRSGYGDLPNLIHWAKSANFKSDHPQALVIPFDEDVTTPDKQAAWVAKLRATGSTVIVNCRPDDPTLPKLQAPIVNLWKAAFGGPATQPSN